MTTIVSINGGSPVTQYQQNVPVVIADGDANNLYEFIFAGLSVPFTVVDATHLTFNAPGTVQKNYASLAGFYDDGVYDACDFDISHDIRVPAPGALVDDDSLLAGIGNASGRYAKVTLGSAFELRGPEITSVNISASSQSLICAKYGTQVGVTGAATVEVLNNTGITQTYDVALVAGANNTGIAPILTIYGGNPQQISLGQAFTPSYSAVDDSEGDITDRVVVTGTVNTNAAGDYPLLYTVQDAFGNETTASQTIQVRQNVRYEIQLLASLDQNVQSVTGTYPVGYIVSENGNRGLVVVQNITLTNGEAIITQSDATYGSLAALAAGGTTTVSVILLDGTLNKAATPINIPLIAIAV